LNVTVLWSAITETAFLFAGKIKKHGENLTMKTICPHCKQEYPEIPDEYLGITLQCSVCEKEFVCEKVNTRIVPPQSQFVPPPNYNRHPRYSTTTDDSSKLPVKYLLGKLIKYTFIAVIIAGIGYAAWYNSPANKQKRANKEAELKRIQNTYMVNNGETDDFREEVKRLNNKFAYEKFGPKATRQDCADSVRKIVNNWNRAVSAFKNADKKTFTDIDSIIILYSMSGLNAYHVSEDFDLPARLLLIQKSQAEAAEVGKKIYEAVLNDDIEEKERLLKEYNRLINQGNLQK
jgi:hypothetical protein